MTFYWLGLSDARQVFDLREVKEGEATSRWLRHSDARQVSDLPANAPGFTSVSDRMIRSKTHSF